VRRADPVDVHLAIRALGGEVAGAARVVEVDVGRHDTRQFVAVDPDLGHRVEDEVGVGADARIDERGPVGVEDVDGAVLGGTVDARVDVVDVGAVAGGRLLEIANCHVGGPSRPSKSVRLAIRVREPAHQAGQHITSKYYNIRFICFVYTY